MLLASARPCHAGVQGRQCCVYCTFAFVVATSSGSATHSNGWGSRSCALKVGAGMRVWGAESAAEAADRSQVQQDLTD